MLDDSFSSSSVDENDAGFFRLHGRRIVHGRRCFTASRNSLAFFDEHEFDHLNDYSTQFYNRADIKSSQTEDGMGEDDEVIKRTKNEFKNEPSLPKVLLSPPSLTRVSVLNQSMKDWVFFSSPIAEVLPRDFVPNFEEAFSENQSQEQQLLPSETSVLALQLEMDEDAALSQTANHQSNIYGRLMLSRFPNNYTIRNTFLSTEKKKTKGATYTMAHQPLLASSARRKLLLRRGTTM